ncbi:DUF2189 domain-containing protein [Halochromatium roseum]|uniref:DUF2189 domain-containing protein n=1 Tax=Halochromatium roseum TaxID=391920 RepID=UPI0019131578|nr:hypothetical protein [Halochromatium roseum]MBK5938273.1 hypothetical protein [Halochromatium roseum]
MFGGIALLLAVLAFRITAVSLPMLIDQRVDAINAAFASWRAVGDNWPAMSLWAILIVLLVTIGILTYFVGLIIVTPILGYASWHAYRETLIPESKEASGRDTDISGDFCQSAYRLAGLFAGLFARLPHRVVGHSARLCCRRRSLKEDENPAQFGARFFGHRPTKLQHDKPDLRRGAPNSG